MLNILKEEAIIRQVTFEPKVVHVDFELAVINAILQSFPTTRITGCTFHFSQCVWRKVNKTI